ncbi:hypothetical protein RN001_008000 [Aquatica leii]|uniref:Tail-anchored protein insertion receptor WRB n=1 Tax=Aquatica leii TaxID=1421715 RepID=A0AAN7SH32_9COLE|nr:hypothetical protein RN001_008000 [Aquatica leii]
MEDLVELMQFEAPEDEVLDNMLLMLMRRPKRIRAEQYGRFNLDVKMLFLLSTALSLLTCLVEKIMKPVFQWINQPSTYERNLINLKAEYKIQQAKLNMVDNFAKYSKIQRKINGIEQELQEMQSHKIRNQFIFRNICVYGTIRQK